MSRAKKYRIDFKVNGYNIRKFTDDVDATILAIAPTQVYTDMFITIKQGETITERHLMLQKTRNLFRNDFDREVFINNMLLV